MRVKYPWVFWITIRKRNWVSNFWTTRGSNFRDIQFFKLHISIGLPWHKNVIIYYLEDKLEGIDSMKKTNDTFNRWYHFHIG